MQAREQIQLLTARFAIEIPVREGYLQSKQICHLTKAKAPEARRWGPEKLASYRESESALCPKSLNERDTISL